MGYDLHQAILTARLSRHNSEQDERDNQALEDFKMEINALIQSTPEYRRIFRGGIM